VGWYLYCRFPTLFNFIQSTAQNTSKWRKSNLVFGNKPDGIKNACIKFLKMQMPRIFDQVSKLIHPNRQESGSKLGVLSIEKRKHPRYDVELPLDYSRVDRKDLYGGIVWNASEGGILVYLPERMELGSVLKIEILYVKGGMELDAIHAVAKVVWSDLAAREVSGENRYGLQFQYIEEKEYQRLVALLKEIGS